MVKRIVLALLFFGVVAAAGCNNTGAPTYVAQKQDANHKPLITKHVFRHVAEGTQIKTEMEFACKNLSDQAVAKVLFKHGDIKAALDGQALEARLGAGSQEKVLEGLFPEPMKPEQSREIRVSYATVGKVTKDAHQTVAQCVQLFNVNPESKLIAVMFDFLL